MVVYLYLLCLYYLFKLKSKNDYIRIVKSNIKNKKARDLLIKQINNYFEVLTLYKQKNHWYQIWDSVKLKKWTLLHWTWKNIEWLENIISWWLISWQFEWWRDWKYLYTVSVRNLKEDLLLKDYVNYYSWWTVRLFHWSREWIKWYNEVKVIPFNQFPKFLETVKKDWVNTWNMEQTKEARFMPSLSQDFVQIWIIINWRNKYAKLLKGFDILDINFPEKVAKDFVHPDVYESFFVPNRKNKDAFFTDRESAILFWLPSVLIEWILVGRKYEKNKIMLDKIKKLLPKAYICNLDGKVIKI